MSEYSIIMLINYVLLMTYVIISAYIDFEYRVVPVNIAMLFMVLGSVMKCLVVFTVKDLQNMTLSGYLIYHAAGFLPGILIMIISQISYGQIGRGDAIFLIVCAFYMEFAEIMILTAGAFMVCAIAALIIITAKRLTRSTRRPGTLPFVTMSMLPAFLISIRQIAGVF